MPKWTHRDVLKPSDAGDLETQAALLEFGEGHDRESAEEAAYQSYRDKVHTEAAAHHLRGLRAGQATGDMEAARQHGEAYEHHLKALDLDPWDAVPDSISKLADSEDKPEHYTYKSHPADKLFETSRTEDLASDDRSDKSHQT